MPEVQEEAIRARVFNSCKLGVHRILQRCFRFKCDRYLVSQVVTDEGEKYIPYTFLCNFFHLKLAS